MSKKIFIGRLSQDANAEDLRQYFERFGRILNAYVPKDPKIYAHREFGFVTFVEDGVADCVSRMSHEICGQQENMTRMLTVTDVHEIIKRHQAQIITSLKDLDISIRRCFLDLLYGTHA